MRIVIGSDHAGVDLKKTLFGELRDLHHELIDVGTDSTEPVDYPDYAEKVDNVVLAGMPNEAS